MFGATQLGSIAGLPKYAEFSFVKSGKLVSNTANFGALSANTFNINGDMTVEGSTFSMNYETVNIKDIILHLNNGYKSETPIQSGLTFNINAVSPLKSFDIEATGFTENTVYTVEEPTFAVGDIVQVSGTLDDICDGLYQVASIGANFVVIETSAITAQPFVLRQFTPKSFDPNEPQLGQITHVYVGFVGSNLSGSDLLYQHGNNSGAIVSTSLGPPPPITLSAVNSDVQVNTVSGDILLMWVAVGQAQDLLCLPMGIPITPGILLARSPLGQKRPSMVNEQTAYG